MQFKFGGRRFIKTSAIAATALATVTLAVPQAGAADATGVWSRPSGSSRIQISSCGNALCGKLVWLKEPRNDVNNPDPAKRGNPLLGTEIVLGMKPTGKADTWKGKVYNAEDGKTYTGYITLHGNSKMELEGCVLGGLICKGETWSRVK
ncbi:DUF2147 domain-containing protein [Rhizobiales bacterium]|uniref:DUF2147 domain-containing protein n=1 Tax=Hongsoonwoonella zoysiae TaxID=2821844 RepID=UPI001560D507|nr:DUF2147 domain-containing protein [Hongsoonwoonella zoysiae]NRG19135.1 DUF2147 domain-containing protein [Hongsoonwoonella zoysiae]